MKLTIICCLLFTNHFVISSPMAYVWISNLGQQITVILWWHVIPSLTYPVQDFLVTGVLSVYAENKYAQENLSDLTSI